MRFVIIATMVAIEACATMRTPTELEAYAATMPVPGLDDFDPIPTERCSPPLVGLYASPRALQDAEKGMQRVRDRAARDVINARVETRVCRIKLDSTNLQLAEHEANQVWAMIGKGGLVVFVLGLVVAGVVVVKAAVAP